MISFTRSWRNWQTHYLEVVAGQPMEVQILSSATSKRDSSIRRRRNTIGAGAGQQGRKSSEPRQESGQAPTRSG
jgi:hypothetical protein